MYVVNFSVFNESVPPTYKLEKLGNRATDEDRYSIIIKWSSIRVMAMGHDFGYACKFSMLCSEPYTDFPCIF